MKKPKHIKGSGSIFTREGSPFLYIGYWNGRRFVKESAKTTDREAAQALLDRRREQVRTKRHVDPREVEKVTVDDLLARLEAHYTLHDQPAGKRMFPGCKAALLAELSGMPAMNVDCVLLESLQEKWKQAGAAHATVNKRLGTLHRAFRLGAKAGRVTIVPPFPERLEEVSAIRQGFLEPGDFQRFVAALPDDGLRDYVEWLGWTAMRRGEASKLRWKYVSSDRTKLTIPGDDRKNRRPHTIPLVAPLDAIIARRWKARKKHPECAHIFHRQGHPIREFRKPWNKTLEATGLRLTPHDLCRSAMRNLVNARVPEKVAMEIAGRKTRSIFDRYHIVSTDQMAEALSKVAVYARKAAKKANVRNIR